MAKVTEGDSIGARLERLRIRMKMTQGEAASKIGVSRSYLSHWECDKREISANDVVKLARLYETSTDYILLGVNPENTSIHFRTGLDDAAICKLEKIQLENLNAVAHSAASETANAYNSLFNPDFIDEAVVYTQLMDALNEMLASPLLYSILTAIAELRLEQKKANESSANFAEEDSPFDIFNRYSMREATDRLNEITREQGMRGEYQVVRHSDYLRTLSYAIEENMRKLLKHLTGAANEQGKKKRRQRKTEVSSDAEDDA
jgi:transcriptional regulator with XRE-family HTH domain